MKNKPMPEEAPGRDPMPEGTHEMPDGTVMADADMPEESNVTPEDQAMYDRFVDNVMSVAYDPKVFPKVLQSLDATDDPKMNLANVTVMVVHFAAQSAAQAGQQIPPDVLMHGGAEIMGDMADLAGKAKIHDYSEDEIEGATYVAMDLYREMMSKDGTLDMDAVKADAGELVMADKEGRLDDLVPGVSARFGAKAESQDEADDEETAS